MQEATTTDFDGNTTAASGRPALPGHRVLLLAGSSLLFAAPLALVEPAAHWARDPELFGLLRGMGGIKALLAVLACAAVWWRLGRTAPSRSIGATYVGGVWVLALAAGLIWQLNAIVAASVLFHAATLTLLITAWRDIEPASTGRSAGHLGEHHRERPAERHRARQRADHRIAGAAIHPARDQAVDQEIRNDHDGDDQQEEQVLERQRYG